MSKTATPGPKPDAKKTRSKVPGSGRKKGTPNKVTAQLREIAQPYAIEALHKLVYIMRNTKNEDLKARVCVQIMERGFGKPATTSEVTVNGDKGMAVPILQFTPIPAKAPDHGEDEV